MALPPVLKVLLMFQQVPGVCVDTCGQAWAAVETGTPG